MNVDDPGFLEIGSNLDLDFDASLWTHFVPVSKFRLTEIRRENL
jgi:hypothetical protein